MEQQCIVKREYFAIEMDQLLITFGMENMCNTIWKGIQLTRPNDWPQIGLMKGCKDVKINVAMEILTENEMKSDFLHFTDISRT